MFTEGEINREIKWLSVPEAADFLGIGEERLRRLLRAKKLPGFKLGGRWIFDRSVLVLFLEDLKYK